MMTESAEFVIFIVKKSIEKTIRKQNNEGMSLIFCVLSNVFVFQIHLI